MKIAHLSDPHLANPQRSILQDFTFSDVISKRLLGGLNYEFSRKKRHSPTLFRSLCQDINQNRPDHIVVTGDITNVSLPSEFQYAKELIALLDFPPSAMTFIPGNHDVYVKKAKGLFETYFPAHSQMMHPVGFPCVQILGDLVLISVSTAEPTLPFFALGHMGKEQREALRNILFLHRGKFRLLLIHHSPMLYNRDFLHGLRDKKELQAILQETGCELVLHGHEHRDLVGSLSGPKGKSIPILGVGSCTYSDPRMDRRARYHVYTFSGSRLVQMETRVHCLEENRFIQYRLVSMLS